MSKLTNKIIAISLTSLIFGILAQVPLAFGASQKVTTTRIPRPAPVSQRTPSIRPPVLTIPTFTPPQAPSAPPVRSIPTFTPPRVPTAPPVRSIPTFIPRQAPSSPQLRSTPQIIPPPSASNINRSISELSKIPTKVVGPTEFASAQSNAKVLDIKTVRQINNRSPIRVTSQISLLNNKFAPIQIPTTTEIIPIPKINTPEFPSGSQKSPQIDFNREADSSRSTNGNGSQDKSSSRKSDQNSQEQAGQDSTPGLASIPNNSAPADLSTPSGNSPKVVIANVGTVSTESGEVATLDFIGDNLINFAITQEISGTATDSAGNVIDNNVGNAGLLKAEGGFAFLSAEQSGQIIKNVINQEGIIEANSVVQKDGRIFLSAGGSQQNIQTAEESATDILALTEGTPRPKVDLETNTIVAEK